MHASHRVAAHSAHDWFVALGIGQGQRIPSQGTLLYSDTIDEKLAKIQSMTQRLEQQVGAAEAMSKATAAPDTHTHTHTHTNALKRVLEPEPETAPPTTAACSTGNNGEPAKEASTSKRARFDNAINKDGKNKWERRDRRGTGRAQDNESPSTCEASASTDRLPKRKVAVKFGYCGIGYSGLQINPGVKTIEGDIFDAFCTAGAVSSDNAVNPNKVGLQRAARTDRGVHAAGNLLSLKLILQPQGLKPGETLVDKVNELLPPFIRIWGVTRVQNGFNARQSCDSRMYEYLLPTYVFIPPKPGSTMHDMLVRIRQQELARLSESEAHVSTTCLDEIIDHPFWKSHGTTSEFSVDMAAKKQYRLTPAHLAKIRSIFNRFLGSHNFYNFTVGKEFRDRSCQRFMKKLTISEPKMIQGVEWLSIKFHGQSFMLHQIRKMIGLLVLIGRTGAAERLVDECFGPARVHIPKAPGLGLLLEMPIFDAYNTRIRNNNDKITKLIKKKTRAVNTHPEDASQTGNAACTLSDELRDAITYNDHTSQMQHFKQQWIYDRIIATEQETNEFGKWLNYLDVFQGPDFEFLNPRGVIPSQAIVKVGEFHRHHSIKRRPDSMLHTPPIPDTENPSQSHNHNHNDNDNDNDDEDEDAEAYAKKGAELDEYEG